MHTPERNKDMAGFIKKAGHQWFYRTKDATGHTAWKAAKSQEEAIAKAAQRAEEDK